MRPKLKVVATKQPSEPLSVGEVARVLGVSKDLVRYYGNIGLVKVSRFGADRRRVFWPDDVDTIRQHREQHSRKSSA